MQTTIHDRDTTYVLPKQTGIESRDLDRYPLPPNVPLALVTVVCDELRDQGHAVHVSWRRERLADWDKTRRMDQHSEALYGSGDTVLHFVPGGVDCTVVIDGRHVRLLPRDFRGGRAGMKFAILGRV